MLWLVAYSCEPFTASTLVAETAPFETPVRTRVPAVPVKSTVVPPVAAATVTVLVGVASICAPPP